MSGKYLSKKRATLVVVVYTMMAASVALFLTLNLSVFLIHYPHWNIGVGAARSDYLRLLWYLQEPVNHQLLLHHIPLSEVGYRHFKDVRLIMLLNEAVMIVSSSFVFVFLREICRGKMAWQLLKPLETIMTMLVIIFTMVFVNFPMLFVRFHYLIFANRDWVFKVKSDPIILMLPLSFFIHTFLLWGGLFLTLLFVLWGGIHVSFRFFKL
jgi:integral membrane protein (TIGR01906 family)